MSAAEPTPREVLLVEDNPGDARLVREAWREHAATPRLHEVRSGDEALAFLRREAGYADAPRPDLVLLDLNLPGTDGREVLGALKGDPGLRAIPVLVLSASRAPDDVRAAYDLHANCYLHKPLDLDRFLELVRCLVEFWLDLAEVPPR